MFDTVLVGLLVLVVALWLVARIVHWLPAHYAKEEAAWLSAIRTGSNDAGLPLSYEPPGTAALWRDFFCGLPPLNGRTLIALIGVVSVALWVWVTQATLLPMLSWFLFGCVLVALALIDNQTKLLPDILTLPMIWLGLLIQLLPETRTVGLEWALIGAVAGYLPLWLLAHAYKLLRGRDGLGMGDLKLLAAMGAWSGPAVLPMVVIVASLLAIGAFLFGKLLKRDAAGLHDERPFGPWIVLAYGIVLVLGL